MTDSPAPQQVRAERTHALLLEATLECLVEHGYSGTSTAAVCRRAGVSRGTLLYHFPTREQILVAALEHVLSRRVQEFVDLRRHRELPPMPVFLQELQAQWEGPALVAWLELAVAARTNPALREAMRPIMGGFDALILQAFEELGLGGDAPPELTQAVPHFVFTLFNGLAVERCYEPEGNSPMVLGLLGQLTGVWAGIGGPS